MTSQYRFEYAEKSGLEEFVTQSLPAAKVLSHGVEFRDVPWTAVLHEFALFLGNVYGYDIVKSIQVRDVIPFGSEEEEYIPLEETV